MTIALDAYRYASRHYKDANAQCRKMASRHGRDKWIITAVYALAIYRANRDQCAASVISKIEAALAADDLRMTQTTK